MLFKSNFFFVKICVPYTDALGNYGDVIFVGLTQKLFRELNHKIGHICNTLILQELWRIIYSQHWNQNIEKLEPITIDIEYIQIDF
jgi:hypothetical protein